MIPFQASVDDIVLSMQSVAGNLSDWDAGLASDILAHFADFAEKVIVPLDAAGDAQGCRLHDGRVQMPDGFKVAFENLVSDGWQGLSAPAAFCGSGAHPLVAATVSEVFSGANMSLQMLCNLVPGAIAILLLFALPRNRRDGCHN